MRGLADLQTRVRDALVLGDVSGLESVLVGGNDPRRRLGIHQRHYQSSLVHALLERFPATVWLVGSELVTDAARAFVRTYPPSRPCIAEYGEQFPAFLAARSSADAISYLRQFAELEWHLSRVSITVDAPPLTIAALAPIDPARLADARLVLQPDVYYLHVDWALDELISLYLAERVPDQFSLHDGEIWLELRGARGVLRMKRFTPADWAFRAALAAGQRLGDGPASAIEIDADFDVSRALRDLFADGLVVAIDARESEGTA